MTHDDPTRKVRQYIGVCRQSRQLVESASPNLLTARRSNGELVGKDPTADMLILTGYGKWFPAMEGTSWAAICDEPMPDDRRLSDITPILYMLLEATVLPMSDASPAEVAAWLKGMN